MSSPRTQYFLCLATESHLLPDHTEWTAFSQFIKRFRNLSDDYVSPRYHYAQLRLTRLNWAFRFYQPRSSEARWYYHEMYCSTGAYVERFFEPLLFMFGSVAIILTAMQVVMTVTKMILLVVILWTTLSGVIAVFLLWQLAYAVRTKRRQGRKSRNRLNVGSEEETVGGMVDQSAGVSGLYKQ